MGQYYRTVILDDSGEWETLSPHTADNGYKLMEHSWVGNSYCNSLVKRIESHNGCRVAHVGDYAGDVADKFPRGKKGLIKSALPKAWGRYCTKYKTLFEIVRRDCDPVYVINDDRQEYIWYEFDNKGAWKVNPITLLLAVGNGLGGGDYCGRNEEMVGTWAMDRIRVSKYLPSECANYLDLGEDIFKEERCWWGSL